MSELNLRVLKPSRKPLRPGDIFVMQILDGRYLFGRVIFGDLPRGQAPMPKANLVYIYRELGDRPAAEAVHLNPNDLLIPPVYTNRLGWSRGYFQTVENRPIDPSRDLLTQHCFRDFTGKYRDETGRIITGAVEPCGDWGLSSYRWIDDHISDDLGIPRAPHD